MKGDVADPKACAQIVAETTARFGRLDGLINNAGLMLGRVHSLEATDEHLQAVINLNSSSVIWVTRAAVPWLEREGGFIINTTSIAARNGGANGAMLYAAAKGFVSTITRGHAKELIGKKIRVNAVSPGVITTPFHDRYSTPDGLEAMRKTIPAARLGTAEDRRRLSVPGLRGFERLRHWPDHRSQRRPVDAVSRVDWKPATPFREWAFAPGGRGEK